MRVACSTGVKRWIFAALDPVPAMGVDHRPAPESLRAREA
jgi:hypothetical protein